MKMCTEVAEKEAKKIGTRETEKKLAWHKKELIKLELPKNLPKGICHCDLIGQNISGFATNTFFKNGEISAVLDFDDATLFTGREWNSKAAAL